MGRFEFQLLQIGELGQERVNAVVQVHIVHLQRGDVTEVGIDGR